VGLPRHPHPFPIAVAIDLRPHHRVVVPRPYPIDLILAGETVDVEAPDPRTVEARRRAEWPPRESSTERKRGPDWLQRDANPLLAFGAREGGDAATVGGGEKRKIPPSRVWGEGGGGGIRSKRSPHSLAFGAMATATARV